MTDPPSAGQSGSRTPLQAQSATDPNDGEFEALFMAHHAYVCRSLSYFGVGDPALYGIRHLPVGFVSNVDRRAAAAVPDPRGPVLLAVSATNLLGVYYADKTVFSWLRERRPVFSAGGSILLYDLTEDPEARRRLSALVRASGFAGAADSLLFK